MKTFFKVSQRCLVFGLSSKFNHFFLKKLIDDSSKNPYLYKTLIHCIILLFIEFLFMFLLGKLMCTQFCQDDIFRIAPVGLEMGGYPHSCALILEVNHILCTGVKVYITCAQL